MHARVFLFQWVYLGGVQNVEVEPAAQEKLPTGGNHLAALAAGAKVREGSPRPVGRVPAEHPLGGAAHSTHPRTHARTTRRINRPCTEREGALDRAFSVSMHPFVWKRGEEGGLFHTKKLGAFGTFLAAVT